MINNKGYQVYQEAMHILVNSETDADYNRAVELFLKALEHGADEFNHEYIGWTCLADYYMRTEDLAKASEAFLNVLKFNPDEPDIRGGAQTKLSQIALMSNDFDEAIKHAEGALSVDGLNLQDRCMALYHRAKALSLKVTKLWESKKYNKDELKTLVDDALLTFDKCKAICTQIRGHDPILLDVSNDINNCVINLRGFRKTVFGGCFIATAAYGSYFAPEVVLLRTFRDQVLLRNMIGKTFVRVYYYFSPPVADFVANHERVKSFVKLFFIEPALSFVRKFRLF